MALYSNDPYGNIISTEPETGFFGEPMYNDRIWSEKLPGDPPEGKVFIMDGITPGWKLVDDTRGTWYRTDTGEEIHIVRVGVPKEGLTKSKPSDKFQKWDGDKWVLDENKKAAYDSQQAVIEEIQILQAALWEIAREHLKGKLTPVNR